MVSTNELLQFLKGSLKLGEPLAPYTSFRIGGPADYFIEPLSREDLLNVIRYFRENGYPFVVIGNGTNILVSDQGFRGAVINLESGLVEVRVERDATNAGRPSLVYAEAGVRLGRLVDHCIQRSLGGLEMLAGIPGTLGGAVVMNAGAFGGTIADHLARVEVVRDDRTQWVTKEDAGFSYRASGLGRDIVLAATFHLPVRERDSLVRARREMLTRRNETQPVNLPHVGSIFKNPAGGHAAGFIEGAGLKGWRIGGAHISPRHANFIVNDGAATAGDVLALIRSVQQAVKEKFNLMLDPELKFIGFEEHALREVA